MSGKVKECAPYGRRCNVEFPGDITVTVSLVKVPDYVIARESGGNKLRCEYEYDCSANGRVVFKRRNCRKS